MNKLIMFVVGAAVAFLFQDNPELVATFGAENTFFDTSFWFPILSGLALTFLEGSDWPPVVKDIIRSLFKDTATDGEGAAHLRKLFDDALDFLAYLKKKNAPEELVDAQEEVVRILSQKVVEGGVTER
jgi:hypothetical protein